MAAWMVSLMMKPTFRRGRPVGGVSRSGNIASRLGARPSGLPVGRLDPWPDGTTSSVPSLSAMLWNLSVDSLGEVERLCRLLLFDQGQVFDVARRSRYGRAS